MSLTVAKVLGAIKIAQAVKGLFKKKEPVQPELKLKEIDMGNELKSPSQSLTVRALVVAGITSVLQPLLGDVGPEFTSQLIDWALEGIRLGSLIVAYYGRKRATGPLK